MLILDLRIFNDVFGFHCKRLSANTISRTRRRELTSGPDRPSLIRPRPGADARSSHYRRRASSSRSATAGAGAADSWPRSAGGAPGCSQRARRLPRQPEAQQMTPCSRAAGAASAAQRGRNQSVTSRAPAVGPTGAHPAPLGQRGAPGHSHAARHCSSLICATAPHFAARSAARARCPLHGVMRRPMGPCSGRLPHKSAPNGRAGRRFSGGDGGGSGPRRWLTAGRPPAGADGGGGPRRTLRAAR